MYTGLLSIILIVQLYGSQLFVQANIDGYLEKNKIERQLFGGSLKSLEPTATLELLKRLKELQSSEKQPEPLIADLVDIGEFSRDKCNLDTFRAFYGLEYSIRNIQNNNIRLYLNYCLEKQFIACENIFLSELLESMKGLSTKEKKDLTLLRDIFLKQTGLKNQVAYFKLPAKFDQVLVEFFKARQDGQKDNAILSPKDQRAFLRDMCINVFKLTEPVTTIYQTHHLIQKQFDLIDNYILERISKIDMCKLVIEHMTGRTVHGHRLADLPSIVEAMNEAVENPHRDSDV